MNGISLTFRNGVDAHRGDGQRFVVRADEKLTAFVELESAIEGVVHKIKTTHRDGQIAARSRAALERKVNNES